MCASDSQAYVARGRPFGSPYLLRSALHAHHEHGKRSCNSVAWDVWRGRFESVQLRSRTGG